MFDVDNLLGYDTNAYQLIQHVVAACFYLNFSHTNVNGLATPLVLSSSLLFFPVASDMTGTVCVCCVCVCVCVCAVWA